MGSRKVCRTNGGPFYRDELNECSMLLEALNVFVLCFCFPILEVWKLHPCQCLKAAFDIKKHEDVCRRTECSMMLMDFQDLLKLLAHCF